MVHKTKKNKAKALCVGHHYTQTNTNNVNKTCTILQTTGGKKEPNKGRANIKGGRYLRSLHLTTRALFQSLCPVQCFSGQSSTLDMATLLLCWRIATNILRSSSHSGWLLRNISNDNGSFPFYVDFFAFLHHREDFYWT